MGSHYIASDTNNGGDINKFLSSTQETIHYSFFFGATQATDAIRSVVLPHFFSYPCYPSAVGTSGYLIHRGASL